ncbi:fumarylacetoacetate hydrolase family protein [Mesobacterium pallidum]|uniref:fumarylacetoacetate hydrolase family protein n=1 Tax=Mesobacterium pallidum TaxID=2872037 RepID=UPI001EE2E0BE
MAGTIVGSGTVSNNNYKEVGSSCLAEARMIETIETGTPSTRCMEPGDTVRIEMFDAAEPSGFGAIDQKGVAA